MKKLTEQDKVYLCLMVMQAFIVIYFIAETLRDFINAQSPSDLFLAWIHVFVVLFGIWAFYFLIRIAVLSVGKESFSDYVKYIFNRGDHE